MEILRSIQESNITCLGFDSQWEDLVQEHLTQLDGSVTDLTQNPISLDQIIEDFSDISNLRDLKLNQVLEEDRKHYYVINLENIIFEEYSNALTKGNIIRNKLRELSSTFYHLKNFYSTSLIILTPIYYQSDIFQKLSFKLKSGGDGVLYLSELVVIFGNEFISIEKNKTQVSNFPTQENIINYIRDFKLNYIL